ncbi:MAG: NADH-quinone oxidoreductase subunit L [Armatimonadetes bacterium]|nr:NADH-quinone oxidoreductase subunit L [Armatimonadota bacterium]
MTVAVPLLGSLLVPLIGLLNVRLMKWYTVALGFVTGALTIKLLTFVGETPLPTVHWVPSATVQVGLQLTGVGLYVAAIAGCIGALVLLYSLKYMEDEEREYSPIRYYFLTILFIGSMIALALADNFLSLYIFWEIIGFCSYALIAYYYKDPKAVRAGTKAFIVTRFGDIGLLAGVAVLWAAMARIGEPTFNIAETMAAANAGLIPTWMLAVAGGGFLAGAIGKSAQFPLHVWLPDAMEAPTTISALIHAATLVNAGVYLCARMLPMFESAVTWWLGAVLWVGAISALLAGVLALMEKDLKRALAFSTISQLGYMMAAVGAASIFASQFHLLNHAIFKALLFLCAGAVIHATGTRNMYEMGGLKRSMPLTHLCFAVGALALAGVPIFNGFWSKDAIFEALLEHEAYGPLLLLVITALLTAAYSWRMYWLTFQAEPRRESHAHEAPWQMAVPLVGLAAGTLVSWTYVGGYTDKLGQQLPFHARFIQTMELDTLWHHTWTSSLLVVAAAVVVIIVGLTVTWSRRGAPVPEGPTMWADLVCDTKAFGDWFWGLWYVVMRGVAALFAVFQTGDVNYNGLWLAVGLIAVLVMFLGWG